MFDGTIALSAFDFLANTSHAKIDTLLAADDVTDPVNVPVNGYLVHLGSHVILIDAGAGLLYGPKLGEMEGSLVKVGYRPEQITNVALTHIHPGIGHVRAEGDHYRWLPVLISMMPPR